MHGLTHGHPLCVVRQDGGADRQRVEDDGDVQSALREQQQQVAVEADGGHEVRLKQTGCPCARRLRQTLGRLHDGVEDLAPERVLGFATCFSEVAESQAQASIADAGTQLQGARGEEFGDGARLSVRLVQASHQLLQLSEQAACQCGSRTYVVTQTWCRDAGQLRRRRPS